MKKSKIVFILVIICFVNMKNTNATDWHQYFYKVQEAQIAFNNEDYFQAGELFSDAFTLMDDKKIITDRYYAAYAWMFAQQIDSVFNQLFIIAKFPQYFDIDYIKQEESFDEIKTDKRWKKFINEFESEKKKFEAHLNKNLSTKLNSILERDQEYRILIEEVMETHGYESNETKELFEKINDNDASNLKEVLEIIDTYGFLGIEDVGVLGNQALFMVIQHADIEIQEKYFPILQQAVKDGKLDAASLAMLEDRIEVINDRKQIYGTQIGIDPESGEAMIFPMIEPEKVNERRNQVYLEPYEFYLMNWDLEWDVEEFIKNND